MSFPLAVTNRYIIVAGPKSNKFLWSINCDFLELKWIMKIWSKKISDLWACLAIRAALNHENRCLEESVQDWITKVLDLKFGTSSLPSCNLRRGLSPFCYMSCNVLGHWCFTECLHSTLAVPYIIIITLLMNLNHRNNFFWFLLKVMQRVVNKIKTRVVMVTIWSAMDISEPKLWRSVIDGCLHYR